MWNYILLCEEIKMIYSYVQIGAWVNEKFMLKIHPLKWENRGFTRPTEEKKQQNLGFIYCSSCRRNNHEKSRYSLISSWLQIAELDYHALMCDHVL